MRRTLILMAAVVALAADAPNDKASMNMKDFWALQGTWKLVKWYTGTKGESLRGVEAHLLVIRGNEMKHTLSGSSSPFRTTFTLDATSTPKHLDSKTDRSEEVEHHIYELDGDTLKINYHTTSVGKDYPKDFKPYPLCNLRVYARVKVNRRR
jgi:uncharacterized protein (TIGR03067 family)